jgi:hypothetical protein
MIRKFAYMGIILILLLLIMEFILRQVVLPHEYLSPNFETHPQLLYKIQANEKGHDQWGFRNAFVPKNTDVVAIGDSFTYGISNKASDAWPSVLSELSNQNMYNLSVGGYGINQYAYLLNEYALALKPKKIILGLYMGDDFAKNRTIKLKRSNQRSTEEKSTPNKIELRHWLAQNSVVYNMLVQSGFGNTIRYMESWFFSKKVNTDNYVFYSQGDVNTIFTPQTRLNNLVHEEGYKNTFNALLKMKKQCDVHNIDFLVVIFPTKEMVFEEAVNADFKNHPVSMKKLFEAENHGNLLLKNFLEQSVISYVDLKMELAKVSGNMKLFYQDSNGHMNRNGHKVAASAIYKSFFTTNFD